VIDARDPLTHAPDGFDVDADFMTVTSPPFP
jgi:hypothetical protein